MALALDASPAPFLRAVGMTGGRCESCRQPGRLLTELVDDLDGARFEICEACLEP